MNPIKEHKVTIEIVYNLLKNTFKYELMGMLWKQKKLSNRQKVKIFEQVVKAVKSTNRFENLPGFVLRQPVVRFYQEVII